MIAPFNVANFHAMNGDRFVLLLDILGFKELIRTKSAEEVCSLVADVLVECDDWTSHGNSDFETILFSDTIVLHTRREGSYREWYDDLVFVGSRVCNRLLARGIPVRGAMSYGPFLTKKVGRHLVFLGQALVDAYTSQDKEPFLGFSVAPEIWRKIYPKAGAERYLTQFGAGVALPNGSFWINPLSEFIGMDRRRVADQIAYDFEDPTDASGRLEGELRAFRFIVGEAARLGRDADVSDRVKAKYTNTARYLRTTLGDELFDLAQDLASRLPNETV